MIDVAFILSAVVCVLSAILIVSRKNPVYSVVFMLPFFLGMTSLFVLLSATFLAAIQMIVYGGAILVVFLFVIMLINLKPDELRDDFSVVSWFLSCLGASLLAALLALFAFRGTDDKMQANFSAKVPAESRAHKTSYGSTENLAYPMFEKQGKEESAMVPFELASLLIVVATLGAVLLSKKRI